MNSGCEALSPFLARPSLSCWCSHGASRGAFYSSSRRVRTVLPSGSGSSFLAGPNQRSATWPQRLRQPRGPALPFRILLLQTQKLATLPPTSFLFAFQILQKILLRHRHLEESCRASRFN